MTDFETQLRRNATYWSEDGEGTAGYLLSEEQFKAILAAHEAAVAEILQDLLNDMNAGVWDRIAITRRLEDLRSRAKLPEEKS